MAFTDPVTIDINGIPKELPRTNVGGGGSEYTDADGLIKLRLNSAHGRRRRHVARLDASKIASDQLITNTNQRYSMSVYTVFDMPPVGIGYTNSEALVYGSALLDWLMESSSVAITKLLGSES
jgi:hypothetical protein